MRRALFVAILAALLVVQPATAAGYPDAEAACGQAGGGENLIAVFPGATQLQDDDSQVVTGADPSVGVYPGTEFRVALCKDGDLTPTRGTEWSLESSPGLTVIDGDDATVTVRVTEAEPSIEVAAKQKDLPGIQFEVRQPATRDVRVADSSVTLAFTNATNATKYATAEDRYLAARDNLTAATRRLNESAAALRAGEGNATATTEAVVPAVLNRSDAVENRSGELQATLYNASWDAGGESQALTALEAVQTDERTARSDARRAMQNYLGALETAERNAHTTVLLNFGGAAILGLLVGAVPGGVLTKRKLEGLQFDREVDSSVSTGPRLLVQPALLAAVALVLTAAALVATGALGTLGGLL